MPEATPEPVAQAPVVAAPIAQTTQTAYDCRSLYIQAGVSDLMNALELQRRENSRCDPQLYNYGGSDACGIAQELPCGKSGCGMPPNADALCQVKWQKRYVEERYGSFAAAIHFHNINNYY